MIRPLYLTIPAARRLRAAYIFTKPAFSHAPPHTQTAAPAFGFFADYANVCGRDFCEILTRSAIEFAPLPQYNM